MTLTVLYRTIIQVWIFEKGVTLEQGPLMYCKGTNRNTDGKLRWMYHYSLPPAKEALIEPSFRLLGSPAAIEGAKEYVDEVLRDIEPCLPLEGSNATLVIAGVNIDPYTYQPVILPVCICHRRGHVLPPAINGHSSCHCQLV